MDENKSAVDDFLRDVSSEDDEFKDKSNIFGDEPVVKEEVVEEKEKPVPFHKDPKLQRFIEKEVARRVGEKPEQVVQAVTKDDEDDYYVRLIGNDTPEKLAMIREAKARDENMLNQAVERALGRVSEEKQRELDAERKADEQLTNAIDEIEETFNIDITSKDPVAKKTRVDFMNFVEKIAPKNAQGEISEFPDMLSAFETWRDMRKTAPSNRAKDLASRSITRPNGTVPIQQEKVTFDNLDSIFERMFKK